MSATFPPDRAEIKALMDAMDDQAEAFLVSCVHFAQYMQTEVEFGLATDLLKGMMEENYARLEYYRGRINEISGKLVAQTGTPPPAARMHGPPKEGGYLGGIPI